MKQVLKINGMNPGGKPRPLVPRQAAGNLPGVIKYQILIRIKFFISETKFYLYLWNLFILNKV